jgi:glyoxylase-like metal-dependent hydrolase (beta-lactamase superfamily II)
MIEKWRLGDVEMIRVEEMSGSLSRARQWFSDFNPAELDPHLHWLAPHFYDPATDHIQSSVHSWILKIDGLTIVIDTCTGNHKPRPGWTMFDNLELPYLDRLRRAGVAPEAVDIVLCTHLHVDHVGWNTRLENGQWVPTFPNARYLFSGKDNDFFGQPDADTKISTVQRLTYADSVLPVIDAGLADMVNGDEDLGHGLNLRPTPGHSPGHVCIELQRPGTRALFSGDLVHSPLQVPLWHWRTFGCSDPELSCRTRKATLDYCADRDLLVLPAHFVSPHAMHIVRQDDRLMPSFDRARAMIKVIE